MLIPRKQNDFAAPYSERTSAKIDVDGQDRPPPEIYLEKRPAVFRTLETGRRQSRFRVRRKDATRCEAKRLYVRPGSRGSGAGRALLHWIIAEARAAGYRELLGDTMPVMERALSRTDRRNWYPADAADTLAACGKLGVDEAAVRAMLARCGLSVG